MFWKLLREREIKLDMKGFNLFLFALLVLSFSNHANSAASKTIQSGRPGQSIGADIVGKNVFQIQSGVELNKTEIEDQTVENFIQNNVLRYGVSEKFELSTVFDIANFDNTELKTGNLQVGGRVSLISEAKGIIPQLAFQTRAQLVDSEGYKNSAITVGSILSAVHDLNDFGSITLNLAMSNAEDGVLELSGGTLSWGKNYDEKLSYFVEYYASKSENEWLNYWDTGVGYLVNNDLLIDTSVGFDLEDDMEYQFVSLGFSWRAL